MTETWRLIKELLGNKHEWDHTDEELAAAAKEARRRGSDDAAGHIELMRERARKVRGDPSL